MSSPNQRPKPFRVIVVGAGIVGLSVANALQLANIDHVVLEKHEKIASLHGAALMIYPAAARILDQFGLLRKILPTITTPSRELMRWPDGSLNVRVSTVSSISEIFECPTIVFDREKCVKLLYENLPDKSKIRTRSRVEHIEQSDTGVRVFLTDGTVEEGDMVIGADGVHSVVRSLMWEHAAKTDPESIPDSDKNAFFSEYKGMFGVSDNNGLPDIGPADIQISFGQDTSMMSFTQPGKAYWALVWREERSQPPNRIKATEEDKEEIVQRYGEININEHVKFKDLWKSRTRAGMLNVEEGILSKWHSGRIVLVGDSAAKMTADIGIGANLAIESAASLCNILNRTVAPDPNAHPSTAELSALFEEFQRKRFPRVQAYQQRSGDVTRMRSWRTPWLKFMITRIISTEPMQRFYRKKLALGIAKGPKLDYVPVRTLNEDAPGWKLGRDERKSSATVWVPYLLLTSTLAIAISCFIADRFGAMGAIGRQSSLVSS